MGSEIFQDIMKIQPAERINKVLPYLFAQIEHEEERRMALGQDLIRLGVGDPDFHVHPSIIEALHASIRVKSNNAYTTSRGIQDFREAVARWHRVRFNISCEVENVTHLIGAKEVFHHLSRAYCDKQDMIIVPEPGYPAYTNGAAILCEVPYYSAPLLKENAFLIDLEAISADVLRKTKLLIMNYPNNPTGAIPTEDFYKMLVDYAEDYEFLVISDNPYSEITFDDYIAPSFLEYGPEHIEINSFSKTFNMPGYRLGFAAGGEDVIKALIKVKSQIDSGGPIFMQHAGIVALDMYKTSERPQVIQDYCHQYEIRRDVVVNRLKEMGIVVDSPKATLYVWAECPPKMKESFVFAEKMMDAGVVVTPGAGFGAAAEGYFRIALVEPVELLEEAMNRMENPVKSLV